MKNEPKKEIAPTGGTEAGPPEASKPSMKTAEINPPKWRLALVPIKAISTSPYQVKTFGEDARAALEDAVKSKTQRRSAKPGDPKMARVKVKPILTEKEICERGCYRTQDGKYGAPVDAFRACLIAESAFCKATAEQISADTRILYPDAVIPFIRYTAIPHWKRIQNHQGKEVKTGVDHRMFFWSWDLILPVLYNAERFSHQDILGLVDRSGIHVTIGCQRAEKGGQCGSFRVALSSTFTKKQFDAVQALVLPIAEEFGASIEHTVLEEAA